MKAVTRGYQVDVKNEELAKNRALRMVSDILEVRLSEKDFLARQDMKYFARGNEHLDEAVVDANALREIMTDQEVFSKIDGSLRTLADYRGAFVRMTQAPRSGV